MRIRDIMKVGALRYHGTSDQNNGELDAQDTNGERQYRKTRDPSFHQVVDMGTNIVMP